MALIIKNEGSNTVKKIIHIIFALVLVLSLICITTTAMAAPNDAINTPAVSFQSPVKAQTKVLINNVIYDNETANYESEAILPTGDGAAGTEGSDTLQIDGFYTWSALGTYSGIVTFVIFATEMLKKLKFLASVKNQVVSYVIALLTMTCVTVFTGKATISGIVLCVFNALVVSLAANGLYNSVAANTAANNVETVETVGEFEEL